MKKPKIDLSKEGLQQLVLHHVEKLILALALVGFAVFAWLGASTSKFDETTPEKLAQQVTRAKQYIDNKDSWNEVVDLRVARDRAPNIIENTKSLTAENYKFSSLSGTPLKSQALRQEIDLAIGKPQDLVSDVERVVVMISKSNNRTDPLANLQPARKSNAGAEEDEERGRRSKRRKEEAKYGDRQTELQEVAVEGMQPGEAGVSNGLARTTNLVSVRGLVPFEELWAEYDAKLKESVGYFPERDRPKFELLQIQRKVGDLDWTDADWAAAAWEDISLRELPYTRNAPEVVAPENYDPVTCGTVPPIALVDYRKLATHPKLEVRSFDEIPEPNIDQDSQEGSGSSNRNKSDDFGFDSEDDDDDAVDNSDGTPEKPIQAGTDRKLYDQNFDVDGPAAAYKVARFFDVNLPNRSRVKYRMRIWVDDPNNLGDGSVAKRSGGGTDGLSGGGLSGGGLSGGGLSGGGLSGGGLSGGGLAGGGRGGGGVGNGRGGDFSGGRGGGRNKDQGNKPKFKKIPITDSMKDIAVRNRIDAQKIEYEKQAEFFEEVLTAKKVDLNFCRATDWVEVDVEIPDLEGAFAVAGKVEGRSVKNADDEYVMTEDPKANIVLADWSSSLHTLVTTHKTVQKGDLLSANLEEPTNVLGLAQGAVLELQRYEFESRRLVLDIMGGDFLRLPRLSRSVRFDSPIKSYETPGEVLVMDLDGNFSVRSTSQDRERYLNWRFQEDESSEFNVPEENNSAENNNGRGNNRGGGLGGGNDNAP